MMNKTKHLLTATMMGGVLLFSAGSGHASDPHAEAMALAHSISETDSNTQNPALRGNITQKAQIRRLLLDRLLERNDKDIKNLIDQAATLGLENLDIHQAYADKTILKARDDAVLKKHLKFLENQTISDNWQRQNLAYMYLGNHYIFAKDNLLALEYAQKALEAIPAALSTIEAEDARYETYDLLYTTFILDRNIEKAINATQKLVTIGQNNNRSLDEVTIVHNLAVLFSKAHDFKTASELSAILITLQNDKPAWQQAIANYGHGANLSESGNYEAAIPFLEKAANLAKGTRFENPANIRLTLAYAKSRQTRKAAQLLNHLDSISNTEDQTWQQMKPYLIHARAEVAFATGQYKEGYIYLQQWVNDRNEKLESLLSEDRRRASEGLALSERVAQEKEARLEYEVAANKEIAKRGSILALFAGLLALALGFITFNLYRQRKRQIQINAELAIARDHALAGEKTKSKFLSMMGHELRTPMNPIISLADILYTRSQDADIKQMLRMISASGRTMLSMVENILIVSDETKRKLTISKQKTNMRNFIRFTCTGFQRDAEDKGLKFVANIDNNIPKHMDIDKLKLKSILTNMLSNAVKFTAQGSIYVSVLMVQDPHLGVSLLLSVKDTGSGMTQDEVDALLEVFEQHDASHTKTYDGVGVGLYVTELYAKAHGGRMAISSHPQDGTRIDVYIPYDMAPQAQLAA